MAPELLMGLEKLNCSVSCINKLFLFEKHDKFFAGERDARIHCPVLLFTP